MIVRENKKVLSKKCQPEPKKIDSELTLPADKVEIGQVSHEQAGVHKKWLILNYVAADCNLEMYQLEQIDNQETVGSDENTHIVAQIDRGTVGFGTEPTWANSRRYYITHDETPGILKSDMLEDQGPINMSRPETLRDFIAWGIKNFPADHVIVILNDHGGGIGGAMSDDSQGGTMSVPEIGQALREAEAINQQKVDIVAFDACLMATTEVGYEIKDNARILLASEETEGGKGWTYKPMLQEKFNGGLKDLQNHLRKRITVSPKEFAEKVVKVNEHHPNDIPTFSAVDLSKMDELREKNDQVAEILLEQTFLKQKDAIREAFDFALEFNYGYDHADLLDQLIKGINNGQIKDKDGKLKKACEETSNFIKKEAVFANEHRSGSYYANASGLTIALNVGYKYRDLAFGKDSKWGKTMEAYYGKSILDQPLPKTWPDGSLRPPRQE